LSAPAVTVAICTRDRCPSLQRALASLLATTPAGDWELLVIDSACSDATPAWLAATLPGLPVPARTLRAELPGIGRARNLALLETRSELLLFLDDDCTVEPGWLAAHRAAFADPRVVGSGGRILPQLPPDAPPWLRPFYRDQHGGPGGRFDFGLEACDLPLSPASDLPFGANYGLRAAPARAAGGFNPTLGWGAPGNLPGEETDLMERLLAAGGRVRYVPDAVVLHHLPPATVTERRYLAYYGAVARLQVRRERARLQRPRSLGTLVYRALRCGLRARVEALLGRRAAALELRRKEIFLRARLADRLEQRRLARGQVPARR